MLVAPPDAAAALSSHAALLGFPPPPAGSILPAVPNPMGTSPAVSDLTLSMSEWSSPPLVSPSDSARHASLTAAPTAFQTPTLAKDGDVPNSARGLADPVRMTPRGNSTSSPTTSGPPSAFSGSPSPTSAALGLHSAFSDESGGGGFWSKSAGSIVSPDSPLASTAHRALHGSSPNPSARSGAGLSDILSDMVVAAAGPGQPGLTNSPPAASSTTSESDSFESSRGSTPAGGDPATSSTFPPTSRPASWPASHTSLAARELFPHQTDVTLKDVAPDQDDVTQKYAVPDRKDVPQKFVPDGNDVVHNDVVPDQNDVTQKVAVSDRKDITVKDVPDANDVVPGGDDVTKDIGPGQNSVAQKDVVSVKNDVAPMEVVSERNDVAPDQVGAVLQDVVSRPDVHVNSGNDVDMIDDSDVWRPW